MESGRFDELSRRMASRRAVGLALGWLALLGLSAGGDARKSNRKHCKRKAIKICTGNTCGKRKNNCGKTYHCTCRGGQTCLPNGGCGIACPATCPQEPGSCACPGSGDPYCVRDDLSCALTPTPCSTMADCPAGRVCAETNCGSGGTASQRCVPLCHPAL